MSKHRAIELADILEPFNGHTSHWTMEDSHDAATLLRSIPDKDEQMEIAEASRLGWRNEAEESKAEIERLKAVIAQPGCDTCELAILDRDLMRQFINETGQDERFGHFVMLGADDPLVTSRGEDT